MLSNQGAGAKAILATKKNSMFKTNVIFGVLALLFFANAQYQGWSLFDRDASATTSHGSGSGGHTYHK
jgi:hypothetical protein